MHTRLLVIFAALFLGSCASPSQRQVVSECRGGSKCRLEGSLLVESLWQASLELPDRCYALALPDDFYSAFRGYDGQRVVVSGDAAVQPTDPPSTFSYSYLIEGDRVNSNLCGLVIVVDEIRSRDQILWAR